MKFIYLYVGYKMHSFQEDYELFLNSVISLINLTCVDNQFNCYYVFQWYKLFVGMILGDINLDDSEPCRIEVDKLLTTIFDTTGINTSVVTSIINDLLDNYSFERYDIKRINLLYDLFKIPEGQPSADSITHEIVMSKMLSPEIFNKVFRPFKYGVPIFDKADNMDRRLNHQFSTIKTMKKRSLLSDELNSDPKNNSQKTNRTPTDDEV
jgi:hypothetical protein